MESILMGTGMACAGLFTVNNAMGLPWMARNSVKVDVCLTLLFFFLFAGTSTMGVLAATWGGLMVAVFSKCLKSYWVWAAERGHLPPLHPLKPVKPIKATSSYRDPKMAYAEQYAANVMGDLFRSFKKD